MVQVSFEVPRSGAEIGESGADMAYAFVIMQIGNDELERVYSEVFVPTITACGLEHRRVDKHNNGGLLRNEIDLFIRGADVIVADLTNERPNVYLEVGFVLGLDRHSRLVLCAREDHLPERVGRQPHDPRVHFDLGGYDILYWSPDKLDEFRERLKAKIQLRQQAATKGDLEIVAWNERMGISSGGGGAAELRVPLLACNKGDKGNSIRSLGLRGEVRVDAGGGKFNVIEFPEVRVDRFLYRGTEADRMPLDVPVGASQPFAALWTIPADRWAALPRGLKRVWVHVAAVDGRGNAVGADLEFEFQT